MRKQLFQRSLLAAALGASALLSGVAHASGPLEYPDIGAASFSRGGAWLATANEPIATHFNPAALATQKSGFSLDMNFTFNRVCYARTGPGNVPTGPNARNVNSQTGAPELFYLPACSERPSFPNTIPSISIAWRATPKLAFGFAIVPPANTGTADRTHGENALGYDQRAAAAGQPAIRPMPAPWRYMTVRELSTILFPTLSVGYEPFKGFRLGAGFVSGIGNINTQSTGVSNAADTLDGRGDLVVQDALTTLRTQDLFVPGVVASLHWSVLPQLDVSVWGRYMDSIRTSKGEIISEQNAWNANGIRQPACTVQPTDGGPRRPAVGDELNACGSNTAINNFPNAEIGNPIKSFVFGIPPEVRLGVRYHMPRSKARTVFGLEGEARDPLHDDVFDIEVNGSYTMNSKVENIEVRFNDNILVRPAQVALPTNADRPTGYKDSYGLRVGGQWNIVQDKLGLRAGGWFESQSQDPAYLQIGAMGYARWGFGGGIVFRQDFIDISMGYQRLQSAGLDNGGNGAFKAATATGTPDSRTGHAVNGGKLTQSAHAFTFGATVRF